MNKRNYILEAVAEGKTPVDPGVISGSIQYYSDLIAEAIFPINDYDTPSAIVAMETIAGSLRNRDEKASELADLIKSVTDYTSVEFNGEGQDMEELHRAVFQNAPK